MREASEPEEEMVDGVAAAPADVPRRLAQALGRVGTIAAVGPLREAETGELSLADGGERSLR